MGRLAAAQAGLASAVALLALLPATAGAARMITVDDSATDATLSGGGPGCISSDADGGCTLRAAVELANMDASGDEAATIDVPKGTFTNTAANGGSLLIDGTADTAIVGAGAGQTIIDSGEAGSVFVLDSDASLTLRGVTIQNGHAGHGGGIYAASDASVSIEQSTVADNTASDEGGGIYGQFGASITIGQSTIAENTAGRDGGGVFAESEEDEQCQASSPGHVGTRPRVAAASLIGGLAVEQSTIADNTAGHDGGGIYAASRQGCVDVSTKNAHHATATLSSEEAGLTVEGSTIAHNTAGEDGGGYGGGIYEDVYSDDPIVNSTIADDLARDDGGGIFAAELDVGVLISDTVFHNTTDDQTGNNLAAEAAGGIYLRNTIVAEPTGELANCEGEINSLSSGEGYNLDYPSEPRAESLGDTCGLSAGDHDLVDEPPGLDPAGLEGNGGPTQTIALLGPASASPSPALGFVPAADCVGSVGESLRSDQRGQPRPGTGLPGGSCDIGAYEFSPTAVIPTCTAPPAVDSGTQVTLTCTITRSDGLFATDVSSSVTPPLGSTLDSSTPSQGSCGGTTCLLGTIDPATVTLVLTPTSPGVLGFTASDAETGSHSTAVPITILPAASEPASVPSSAPPAASAPAPASVAAPTIGHTTPKPCRSMREFRIHIQHVKQLGIVSAVVSIDGRAKRTLRDKSLTTMIDLRGLPKGTFTVEIVARRRNGRTVRGKRVYHTCTGELPGHPYLPL